MGPACNRPRPYHPYEKAIQQDPLAVKISMVLVFMGKFLLDFHGALVEYGAMVEEYVMMGVRLDPLQAWDLAK